MPPNAPGIKLSDAYLAARAVLAQEYRETFSRDWDDPPWGGAGWSNIMPRALELDHAYLECIDHFKALIRALDNAREFLQGQGFDLCASTDGDIDLKLVVGHTLTEFILYLAFTRKNAALQRTHAYLSESLEALESDWNLAFRDLNEVDGRVATPPGNQDTNSVAPSRGLVYRRVAGRNEENIPWGVWLPGIVAPPPESLRTDSHEWRRWYVSTVLDEFDRNVHGRRTGVVLECDLQRRPVVTDRDVAVISLLAGGLKLYTATELRKLPDVINAERKAVGLARRRARERLAAHWRQATTT